MFRKLFRPSASPPAPSVGAGTRVYAIGDIHGCLDELDRLLAHIAADGAARPPAEETLVFLGDVIDRGPRSADVVGRLLALSRQRPTARFLKGNHEEVFLQALDGDAGALRFFCRIGGRETILSYGLDEAEYDRLDFAGLAEALERVVPAAHRDFLDSFEDMVEIGDYAFVHAGIRPGTPLADQRPADLRWIRNSFLDHRRQHPRMIVHGHTITDEVDRQPNRIGVDTGAYASGRLSAIGLEDGSNWTVTS